MKRRNPLRLFAIQLLLALFTLASANAGSATWNLSPITGDWNNSANWTPATVPNGASDVATFASSNVTSLTASANVAVDSVVFIAGASAYTISPNIGTSFTVSGSGVINNSGVNQTFVTAADGNFNHVFLNFTGSTSVSGMVTFVNKAAPSNSFGGTTSFLDTSNSGSATFLTDGGMANNPSIIGGAVVFTDSASAATSTFITDGGTVHGANGGEVAFLSNATAANATIINSPGTVKNAQGGFVEFQDNATAGDAVITNNGATVEGALGGATTFTTPSRAGHSTLIANGGSNGGRGGQILFGNATFGDFARVELFGNGFLNLENIGGAGITIGSLEGNGRVIMGAAALAVGSNNQSTIFSGTIADSDFAGGGSFAKTGSGTLTLTQASTYSGPTTIRQGKLEVRNRTGSTTGTGAVNVKGGSLAGNGIIAGDVSVASGTGGTSPSLSPGRASASPQILTFQGSLSFGLGATYICDLNSSSVQADKAVAAGITIVGAAEILLADAAGATLPPGATFTILDNTSASPIAGVFANLADGAVIAVGSNSYLASYEGGDGNDLTLTVVP